MSIVRVVRVTAVSEQCPYVDICVGVIVGKIMVEIKMYGNQFIKI